MKKCIVSLCAFLCLLVFACTPAMADGTAVEEAVSAFLSSETARKAAEAQDPWVRFVYAQGISELTAPFDTFDTQRGKPLAVQFMLCSGDPKFKVLGKYDGSDPAAYLAAAAEQLKIADFKAKLNLKVTQSESGYTVEYAKGAEALLEKAAKSAAAKGRKAMSGKTMLAVITDYLAPSPIAASPKKVTTLNGEHTPAFEQFLERNSGVKTAGLSAATFYTIKGQKLDCTGGPEALKLAFSVADMSALADDAYLSLYSDYCYDVDAKSYTYEQLEEQFERAVEKLAIAYKRGKQKGLDCSLTLDLFAPDARRSYADYQPTDDPASAALIKFSNVFGLSSAIQELPDDPALEFPKSGVVSGKSKGTKVILRNRNKAVALCLTFINEGSGNETVVFVRPNEKATIYLPKGYYTIEQQFGVVWYGPEHRFGNVSATETEKNFHVLGSDYYHTLTFGQ